MPAVLLQRLLDKEPTGPHVNYTRLFLAQMKLSGLKEFTGVELEMEAAIQEYYWLANHLDYAPAQFAIATFCDPASHPEGDVWDGLPFHLLEGYQGLDESPLPASRERAIAYYFFK